MSSSSEEIELLSSTKKKGPHSTLPKRKSRPQKPSNIKSSKSPKSSPSLKSSKSSKSSKSPKSSPSRKSSKSSKSSEPTKKFPKKLEKCEPSDLCFILKYGDRFTEYPEIIKDGQKVLIEYIKRKKLNGSDLRALVKSSKKNTFGKNVGAFCGNNPPNTRAVAQRFLDIVCKNYDSIKNTYTDLKHSPKSSTKKLYLSIHLYLCIRFMVLC